MDARSRLNLNQRLQVARVLMWTMLASLLAVYAFIQLGLRQHFTKRARDQAVKHRAIPAPRGIVYDRNGDKLVDNRRALHLVIQREDIPRDGAQLQAVAQALDMSPETLARKVAQAKAALGNRRVLLQDNLDEAGLAQAELLRARFPFLSVDVAPRRTYLGGNLAGHVLGYVGEVSPDQLEKEPERFQPGEIIGKAGFEAGRNDLLKGLDGSHSVLVDNLGRQIDRFDQVDPKPGTSLYLTLDAGLQQVVKEAFGEEKGAAVAIDLEDGGILALYSSPSIDPNLFLDRRTGQQVAELWNDPARPMLNRAIQGRYPPGSTFKLLMALAALEKGIITPETVFHCTGKKSFFGAPFRCEHTHGSISLVPAIAHSCNIYFYELGARMDIDDIHAAATRYGLLEPTGVDLPHEKASHVPSRAWKAKVGRTPQTRKWYAGETISVSIGQGDDRLTPLGLARFYAMIATRGRLLTPHLLLGTRSHQTAEFERVPPPPDRRLDIDPRWMEVLAEGMHQVVEAGTARSSRIEGLDMVGKTGTAQVRAFKDRSTYSKSEKRFKDHAWFAGYAPEGNPKIAFAVILENAGFGASSAAPIARKMCEYWFLERPKQRRPAPAARIDDLAGAVPPSELP